MNMLRKILFFGLMTLQRQPGFRAESQYRRQGGPSQYEENKLRCQSGFNSSMFMVSELKIKDVTIDEVQNNYKIGYFGALFMRINMKNIISSRKCRIM